MTGTRIIGLAIVLLMLSTLAFGVDVSPDEIQEKVAASYRALDTYKAEGTITSDMGSDGTQRKLETSFTILLKKPNLYLITWTQAHKSMPGLKAQSGAVWSDGTQPYLYMSAMHESHVKVSFPALSKSDFKFALPEGTVLKDSLFGSVFKEDKAVTD